MNQFDRGGHQTVKRWTRKIDLFDKDIIFFPVNLANMHWVLAVINKRKKRFEYYDSLAGPDPGVLAKLRRYYKDEYRAKNNEDLDLAEWSDYQPVRSSKRRFRNSQTAQIAVCLSASSCTV